MAAGVTPITLSNFTGLDFNQILQATVAADQVPITDLQNQVAAENVAISTLGTIGADYQNLQSALTTLNDSVTTPPMTTGVSTNAPFTAAVNGAPLAGTYTVSVSQLASAESLGSQGYASDTAGVGDGIVTINVGGTNYNITVDSSNDTLDGLASAITAAGAGVTAQVVNTGLVGAPYRLLVTSNTTGSTQGFTITSSLSGGTAPNFAQSQVGPTVINTLNGTATPTVGGNYTGAVTQSYQFTVTAGGTVGTDPITIAYTSDTGESGSFTVPASYSAGSPVAVVDGLTLNLSAGTLQTGDSFGVAAFTPQVTAAQNATLQVGGQIVSSSSNQVTNAVPGVTLSLTGTGGPATLTVGSDTQSEGNQISAFVSAYNQLLNDIQKNTQAVPNQAAPPLAADGGLRTSLFSLQFGLGQVNLAQLGITVDQTTGQLSFSQSSFAAAQSADPTSVTQAITSLYNALNPVVSYAAAPTTGLVATETASDQQTVTNLNQQIATLNQQLTAQESQLQLEYGQIQAQVAGYQNIAQLFATSSSSGSGSSVTIPGSNLTVSA
ncbi:MAG TPA: flagellar filament capping protein FliD [Candidatus Binataceae bacterium]|nr:flagellar filament capping protein FliD [Candidatus Binataceae bacterium]